MILRPPRSSATWQQLWRLGLLLCLLSSEFLESLALSSDTQVDGRRTAGRLVSIPDLHGDYDRTLEVLAAAKLIDRESLAWVGGSATLVQLGDVVDRGDDGKDIYELLFRLQAEAPDHGGKVVVLLGNHEIMNIQMDWRYVSPGDVATYLEPRNNGLPSTWNEEVSEALEALEEVPFQERELNHWDSMWQTSLEQEVQPQVKLAIDDRGSSWSRTGHLGSQVRNLPVVHREGGVIFVHAGLDHKELVAGRTPEMLNHLMKDTLAKLGQSNIPEEESSLLDDNGPVWTRTLAQRSTADCEELQRVLDALQVSRMVVGHTPQLNIEEDGVKGARVNTMCDGRVVLSDTGISRALNGELSFVEHDGYGMAEAIFPDRTEDKRREPLPLNGKIAHCIFQC